MKRLRDLLLGVPMLSRHCELRGTKQEAIQKPLCNSVSSPRTSVKQKNSYTENHREPQRTTEATIKDVSRHCERSEAIQNLDSHCIASGYRPRNDAAPPPP